jgi:hypothetical protein
MVSLDGGRMMECGEHALTLMTYELLVITCWCTTATQRQDEYSIHDNQPSASKWLVRGYLCLLKVRLCVAMAAYYINVLKTYPTLTTYEFLVSALPGRTNQPVWPTLEAPHTRGK